MIHYFKRPLKPMNSVHSQAYPVILLDIGYTQVFHYQTETEFLQNKPYERVYWKDTRTHMVYGPFQSIHMACQHSSSVFSEQSKHVGKVVRVDFKSKKRINV